MTSSLDQIERRFLSELSETKDLDSLEKLRVSVLGKKGALTDVLRSVGRLSPEERPKVGEKVNVLRAKCEEALATRKAELERESEARALAGQKIDIGLPGRNPHLGTLHPLTIVEERILEIFAGLGFSVEEGPEVETDYFNFEALNFPPEHPARDMQDTFFLEGGLLLRTHTSPVQIRVMEERKPPHRVVVPGRVYRHDSDNTHSPVFHQVEGLCVGADITFADLRGTLQAFVHSMFGPEIGTRFRPSFFPFTEPSAEVDMACGSCRGKGCRLCKQSGWIEILGCGMVDPNVFINVGRKAQEKEGTNPYDPEKISGFAFGMGVERIAMVLHGIDDIRLFYENDQRFLDQFRGAR